MSKRSDDRARSINQRVGNRGGARGLDRGDAFTAYTMDRFLYRLGRSRHVQEFFLKGGVLVANLVSAPHRFTRDIDLLRRRGRPSPDVLRQMFRDIIAVPADDGITFKPQDVRAVAAVHDDDGYDGVKVFVRARVAKREVELRIDIGFGDAVVPPALHRTLDPFLDGDEPARLLTYAEGPVIAEKVETLLSKFPVVLHRLKDILDVVALADAHAFAGAELVESVQATFQRRGAVAEMRTLDDMRDVGADGRWCAAWAAMLREKAVESPVSLDQALERFDGFVRPTLLAVAGQAPAPGHWKAGGPWL